MKIIKRSGRKMSSTVRRSSQLLGKQISLSLKRSSFPRKPLPKIASDIETRCAGMNRAVDVETIQDWVEIEIMKYGAFTVAKKLYHLPL